MNALALSGLGAAALLAWSGLWHATATDRTAAVPLGILARHLPQLVGPGREVSVT